MCFQNRETQGAVHLIFTIAFSNRVNVSLFAILHRKHGAFITIIEQVCNSLMSFRHFQSNFIAYETISAIDGANGTAIQSTPLLAS